MKINVISGTANALKYASILARFGHSVNILKPTDQYTPCDAVVIASPIEMRKHHLMTYAKVCPVLCESPVTWCPSVKEKYPHMLAAYWLFTSAVHRLRNVTYGATYAHLWFDCRRRDLQDCSDLHGLREMVTALYLFGSLQDSKVFRRRVDGGDVIVALCCHKSGVLSTINYGNHSISYERGIRIMYNSGKVEQVTWDSPDVNDNIYRKMISHWLRAIKDQGIEWPTLALGYEAYLTIKHGEEQHEFEIPE